ncbi:hypothetical protein IMZ48_24985 [Candidatus Bathyarchaeota archaeon]|nr:hypothetical protein [Candidatus Bathyarchaeota archaeon]
MILPRALACAVPHFSCTGHIDQFSVPKSATAAPPDDPNSPKRKGPASQPPPAMDPPPAHPPAEASPLAVHRTRSSSYSLTRRSTAERINHILEVNAAAELQLGARFETLPSVPTPRPLLHPARLDLLARRATRPPDLGPP